MIRIRYLTSGSEKPKYLQGQLTENGRIREYFYYFDHQGQLFLDDTRIKNFTSCYKEQNFLEFFFKNLRMNKSDRYREWFPFVSYCGSERNYLRCDDLPFLVTQLKDKIDLININLINSCYWMFKFNPENLYHNPETGRLYYSLEGMAACGKKNTAPDHEKIPSRRFDHYNTLPCQLALVKSEISINLLKSMQPDDSTGSKPGAFKFDYKTKSYRINNNPEHPIGKLVKQFSSFKGTDS